MPKQGKAEFNQVLFNYQSYAENPAVLTILAAREGTSVTVIDNERDRFSAGQSWGQRLFHNHKGERASLTGERLSDFDGREGGTTGPSVAAAGHEGLNMVLLIQVPLKQKNPRRYGGSGGMDGVMAAMSSTMQSALMKSRRSDVESAVIGHGKVEGPFTEIDGLEIERDERFPVRVTVQFYKATSNGILSESDMTAIAGQIKKVYDKSDYVGSLVLAGETGRVTEHDGSKVEPVGWWRAFWRGRQPLGNWLTRDASK